MVRGLDKAALLWGLQNVAKMVRGKTSSIKQEVGVKSECPKDQVTKASRVEGAASSEVQGQNSAGH